MSLNNQSNRLYGLGRREEAQAAIEEAVTIRRQLAQARPDAFLPDLAMALNNQSTACGWAVGGGAGRDRGSRSLYRQLAQARPDAFLPDFAAALNNQSGCLSGLGRWQEALAAIEEAAGIYRQLAQARPDAFLPDLAMALNNLASTLSSLNRPAEASVIREEATAAIGTMAQRSAERASEETNAQPSDP